jgi:hypothetical protein
MRRVSFPRIWPARAVGSRTLPVTLQPGAVVTVPGPLPAAGGFSVTEAPSRHVIDGDAASPGRSFLGRTGDDLDSGPAPNRIDRNTPATNAGKITGTGGPDGMAGWPYDGNALFVPHTVIPRTPITVSPFARTIDTGVTIPSLPIGGPVG